MEPQHFLALLRLIKDDAIFCNNSVVPQIHPRYQLAVLLFRLGNPGGISHEDTSTCLHLAEGTVSLYSNRTLRALHRLKSRFIRWPEPEERKEISRRIAEKSKGIFQDVVGFIDGTYITLKYTPMHDYFYYFNRKYTYGLNATVVCDDRRRILWSRAGDTSAVHDARIFSRSNLSQESDKFFSRFEYLLGDSAYTPAANIVTPIKKPRASHDEEAQFKASLSSQRVVIEHTFGQLKARFPYLTSDDKSHRQVVEWV